MPLKAPAPFKLSFPFFFSGCIRIQVSNCLNSLWALETYESMDSVWTLKAHGCQKVFCGMRDHNTTEYQDYYRKLTTQTKSLNRWSSKAPNGIISIHHLIVCASERIVLVIFLGATFLRRAPIFGA